MRWITLVLALAASTSAAEPRSLEPSPLVLGMQLDAALRALEAAGLQPERSEIRRYPVDRRPGQPRHSSQPVIAYVPRPGWTGLVKLTGDHVRSVRHQARLPAAAIARELAALARRFGAARTDARGERTWKRGSVTVTASVTPAGSGLRWLTIDYRPG